MTRGDPIGVVGGDPLGSSLTLERLVTEHTKIPLNAVLVGQNVIRRVQIDGPGYRKTWKTTKENRVRRYHFEASRQGFLLHTVSI